MKTLIMGAAAAALLCAAPGAFAQDTTVVHKDNGMGDSKTVVHHANGAKTMIKRHGRHVKKVHVSPNGDKTVVKKTEAPQ